MQTLHSNLLATPPLPSEVEFVRWEHRRLIVRMKVTLPTSERGHILLEIEKRLRREIDPSIEVFLEPKGDLNKLRIKLRGVKV